MKRRSREIRQKARMSIDCLQIVSAAQLSSVPQCHDCHIFSFTEAFSCSCSPQKIACIQHLKGLCSCEPQMIILSERLSDSDFDFLSESMTAQKIKADHWKNGLRLTLQRPTPPSLETLRGLLRLGETLPVIPCEVLDLGLFVTKATQWVVSASKVLTRKLRKTDISPLLSLATDIFGQEKEWNAIILLLEKGTSLSVDIPEYHQLSQFVARGSKLRLRLRGLLNFDRRLPLIEYENAFVDIMELEIGFPEIPALAQHIHFLRWRTQVSALLQHERPRHKDMVNLIHRARQSNYFSSDSCFTELLALEHEVEMWRQNVRTFMEQNSSAKQTYQALTALILRGRQLPSPDGVMSKLEGMEERFQLWLRHAGEILELDSNGRLLLKKDCSIDMTEFELILQSAEQLEVRVEFGDFSRQRKAVDRWRTFGKRVLRRQHYTQSFADMVAYLAYNVRCCTTYIHDADRYCICRQLDGDGSIMVNKYSYVRYPSALTQRMY